MMERTEWFPGFAKPVRPGVYEVQAVGFPGCAFARWTGKCWSWVRRRVEDAHDETELRGAPVSKWRGLASDPSNV